ncbi:MAG: division/cell wall cluster transcriptional repressor MraZ [Methylophilaceae bacterium]|nr:division/cell wall cluster transcriptional repressor MraZ [Methylophilaceae bacterium]MDG1453106.1 division/cell wall cluster transcriptional repressor MraZ [Methylophilaceae bacterium]
MFKGATNLNMDAKGRLAIPAKHREALLVEIVLTAHSHPCLLLYPASAWGPIQSKIMSLSSFDKKSAALQRRLVGYAEDISLDSAGRLLVSPVLRELAGLEKEVMLIGQGSHFELWSKEAWFRQSQEAINEDGEFEMPSELEGFSL